MCRFVLSLSSNSLDYSTLLIVILPDVNKACGVTTYVGSRYASREDGRPALAIDLWAPNCDRSTLWYSGKSRALSCGIIPEQNSVAFANGCTYVSELLLPTSSCTSTSDPYTVST
jgi:hypothetical protein